MAIPNNYKITSTALLCLIAAWNSVIEVQGFGQLPASVRSSITKTSYSTRVSQRYVSISSNDELGRTDSGFKSAVLPYEDINPIIKIGSGDKEKVINSFGLWAMFVSLIVCPIWYVAMKVVGVISMMDKDFDPHKSIHDSTGKIWANTWLFLTNSYPEITGETDQIKEENGACLYVANHASWLDIPIVCTVLSPVFKFISKKSLGSLPCIGDQLTGGDHILIDREDRRSQLRTFKEGINWLKKGVPLMAFPEGQRSPDGHLMDFKGGAFSMAIREKVPIVPITISNAHAVMPGNALFPVQSGANKLRVHVHPAIHVEGHTDEELEQLVRSAIISKLPLDQLPVEKIVEGEDSENSKELQTTQ